MRYQMNSWSFLCLPCPACQHQVRCSGFRLCVRHGKHLSVYHSEIMPPVIHGYFLFTCRSIGFKEKIPHLIIRYPVDLLYLGNVVFELEVIIGCLFSISRQVIKILYNAYLFPLVFIILIAYAYIPVFIVERYEPCKIDLS